MKDTVTKKVSYRGRIAPTPSGYLHLGHAATFWTAQERARGQAGTLVLRNEDLDRPRCKPEFYEAMLEDMCWFGLKWDEGPDVGGAQAPYNQSERNGHYLKIWGKLRDTGLIYPSPHSRKDIQEALRAPQEEDSAETDNDDRSQQTGSPAGETVFPTHLRPPGDCGREAREPGEINWRFRVPDGESVTFTDLRTGKHCFVAGTDFGDFPVWRKDGFPSYEMAVVADDHAMGITEVVRGEDLLLSTARQLLIYRALAWPAPDFYHCKLVRDLQGKRLAKRTESLSLRTLRQSGWAPGALREQLSKGSLAAIYNTSSPG